MESLNAANGSVGTIARLFNSRHTPSRLLHAVVDAANATAPRTGVSPPSELLQLCVLVLPDGASIVPHEHGPLASTPASQDARTQEAWIILKGSVRARLFDEDRNLMSTEVVGAGEILVTFRGGHAFDSAEPGTVLVELKNGPYLGRDYVAFESTEC